LRSHQTAAGAQQDSKTAKQHAPLAAQAGFRIVSRSRAAAPVDLDGRSLKKGAWIK